MRAFFRPRKHRVWLVDDREENRRKFHSDHESEFTVETFAEPDSVLHALREGRRPDALLCDVYFYKDEEQREKIEKIVDEQIRELQKQAEKFQPKDAEEGIALMESVRDQFGGNIPFPIFAYTSKGPYLLHSASYDRIEDVGARWLFKKKFSVLNERKEIRREIAAFEESHDWRHVAWNVAWKTGLLMSIFGAALGVIADRVAHHFGF